MRALIHLKYIVSGILAVSIAVMGFAGNLGSTQLPTGPFAVVPPVGHAPKAAPAHPKLDSGLNRIVGADDPAAEAEKIGYRVRDGRIQVYVVVEEGQVARISQWLTYHDAESISSANDIVQAHVKPGTLELLDVLPGVVVVRRPTYLVADPTPENPTPRKDVQAGNYLTEGLAAMNGDAWQAAGYAGQGVKIGVIDLEFGDVVSLLGIELPPTVGWWQCPSCQVISGKNHGTACAEIIADIVPGAELYLAQTSGTTVDSINAAQWLRSQGVNVISESLQGVVGPGDGTGDEQDEIAAFTNAGGIWAVAAGNYAEAHWQGPWEDGDGDGLLDFDGLNIICIADSQGYFIPVSAGTEITAHLLWSQWSSPPQTDLNLYLMMQPTTGGDWILADSSQNPQSGQQGQMPWEVIQFSPPVTSNICFQVQGVSGPGNIDIEFYAPNNKVYPNVVPGSLTQPADAPSALSAAALDAGSPFNLESYSCAGPTNGPGGSLAGGLIKPDISGFANVSTWSKGPRTPPGGGSFNGTSAACPHVAGAAALVWSAHPTWSNAQVRSFLESNAVDMGPAGKDNDYGYGRLWLGDPPLSCTYSISPSSQNFAASGGSGTISVSTQSGCTWSASESLSWVSITSGSSGSGSGAVSFTVTANSSTSPRSGTIEVAGQTFSISQDGATSCSYSISPASQNFGSSGGSGTISVSTQSGCTWSASESLSWVSIISGSSGSGSGAVSFSVSANSSTSSRSGTI